MKVLKHRRGGILFYLHFRNISLLLVWMTALKGEAQRIFTKKIGVWAKETAVGTKRGGEDFRNATVWI